MHFVSERRFPYASITTKTVRKTFRGRFFSCLRIVCPNPLHSFLEKIKNDS